MPSFDEVGFLSEELEQWKRAAHEAYADAFAYAYRANAIALRVMKSIPLERIPEEIQWAIAAFARAMSAFEGCVLMIERGAMADARALARLCAETVIVAKGLAIVPGTLEILREDDANHDLGVINRLLEFNAQRPDADPAFIAQALEKKAELEARFPNRRSVNYRTLALATGLAMFYEVAYRYTSGDGAHATLGAFVRHMKQGNDGEPDAFFFGPDVAGMASTLLCACVAVTELIDLAVGHMGREEDAAELSDLKLHWHIIRHDLEARAATENGN
ncbi:DUF5677 domain-containing protein [Paraburkholderia sp. BCC1885]|uniref:DUF5677 domain-containing protein n=1 Tax=Paraburkholderia sp. BCC1885 TaxID=2562669 RepID=UPI0011826B14|nr:DUF5677 domain-containing protein [Paraburkholderia sp. BCC1885]